MTRHLSLFLVAGIVVAACVGCMHRGPKQYDRTAANDRPSPAAAQRPAVLQWGPADPSGLHRRSAKLARTPYRPA